MTPPATPLRILVVDDEPAIQRLLKAGLSPDGYTVTEVDNGISALEAVNTCSQTVGIEVARRVPIPWN